MLGCGSGTGQGDVLEFRLLGPLEVLEGDRVLPLGGEKQRAALAMLLLHRNTVVSRDRLIGGIWGETPPVSARPTLDTYMSRLRKVLRTDARGPRLVTRPPGYLLRVEDGELDLQRFDTLLDRARSALASRDWLAGGEDLREALSLFKGAPLEDLAHVSFAQAEVGRLEELRLGALELRLDADLETGDHAEVVGELESLVPGSRSGSGSGPCSCSPCIGRAGRETPCWRSTGPGGSSARSSAWIPVSRCSSSISGSSSRTPPWNSPGTRQRPGGRPAAFLRPRPRSPIGVFPRSRSRLRWFGHHLGGPLRGTDGAADGPPADGRRPSEARRSLSSSCSSPSSFRPSAEGGGGHLPSSVREWCCST